MKKVIIFSTVFFTFVALVSFYEFFVVKTPFFEVIPAYALWTTVALLSFLWLLRVVEAARTR
ncbi:MAG: hypothetical protein ACRC9L_08980 [Brevinema sp.]